MQKNAKVNLVSAKKAPNIMGHEIPSTPLQFFFKIIIFHFLASSQESQMTQWNDKNFKMFTFVSVLLQWRHKYVQCLRVDVWLFTKVKQQLWDATF